MNVNLDICEVVFLLNAPITPYDSGIYIQKEKCDQNE